MITIRLIQNLSAGPNWAGDVDGKITSIIIVNPNFLERLFPDKSSIFTNPNFWTFLSGVIGAIIGASATFWFQRYIESKKRKTEIIEEYLKAAWALVCAVGVSRSVRNGSYGEFVSDTIRHLQIPIGILERRAIPAINVSKLIGRSAPLYSGLFNGIEETLANWRLLYEMIDRRNNVYENIYQPELIRAKHLLGKPDGLDSNEITSSISRDVQTQLKSLTDGIYGIIERIEETGSQSIQIIALEIRKIDRKQMVIGLDPLE